MHAKRETVQVRKLHLTGFKSFVQPTELAVEPGLTGIVGPNGCGKSNLVEALRWVMGESSARGLRGGEMDDVIFAGTGARPAFDLAEVSLHMTANGVRIPGFEDAEELELARRIGRGAGSGFRLNGRELRARDVQLLFADAASGARSAAIVSQGQIGALVDAKPADRRRLLEEAAGISGLQARRHEAELKLRAAEANLLRLDDLLQTLGEQHEQLKKQARQARRYGEIGARLREVEARLLIARWQRSEADLAEARAAVESAGAEVQEADRALAGLRAARDERRAALASCRQTASDLGAEVARLAERVAATEATLRERQLRRSRLEDQHAAAGREQAEARDVVAESGRHVARLTEESGRLERERNALGAAREAAAAEAEAAAADLVRIEVEHRALVGRHGELQASDVHLRRERAQVDEERSEIAALTTDLEGRSDALARDMPADADADALVAAERAAEVAGQALLEAAARVETAEGEREAAREALRVASERLQAAERAREDRLRRVAAARQARESLALRRDELAGRRAPLRARRDEVLARLQGVRQEMAALGLDVLEAELAGAEAAALALDRRLAAGRADHEAAVAAAGEAAERVREIQREIERMTAEATALAELTAGGEHGSALDAVTVDDRHADALAAALGDDLLAGLEEDAPAHWCGDPGVHSPGPLPDGARPLAELVAAPAMLGPRLGQVGLVAVDDASLLQQRLRPGQRLVSLEGDLWRWDGFVRRAVALGPVAARLRHAGRRRALDDALAAQSRGLEMAEAEHAARQAAAAAAAAGLDQTASEATAASARVRELERRLGDGRAHGRALDAQARSHAETLDGLEHDSAELESALARLDGELAALPPEPDADPADAGDDASLHRAEEQAVAADRDAAALLEAARAGLAACREQDEECRRALEEARADARARDAARREHAFAEERLAGERTRLDERRTTLDARADTLARDSGTLTNTLAEVAEALAASSATMATLGESLRAARQAEQDAARRLETVRERQHDVQSELRIWRERGEAATARTATLADRLQALADELAALPEGAGEEPDSPLRAELARGEAAARAADERRLAEERELAAIEDRIAATETARGLARERAVRAEGEAERAEGALGEAVAALRSRPPPPDLEIAEEAPEPATIARLDEELARLTVGRERLGAVNLRAVDELAELEMRLTTLAGERDELVQAIERLRRAINALNREGRERLKAAFAAIETHFEALFVRLFGGGQARLSLTDLEDPLAAGLELAASPPGKKLQSLALLSGGEKALTALALIFAVFLSRPSPLCVLDEVDAPLDDANVERFGHLLDELARGTDTRFLVITHHPLTMAHMDRLYGVTMLERGVSELVSVDLSRAIELRQSA